MRTLRFVHASDFHLDAPFQGLTAAKAAMRREEQREMLQRFAALGDNVDLILLSGNLFDSSSGGSSSGQELMDALGHARCPVILSPGSRDTG